LTRAQAERRRQRILEIASPVVFLLVWEAVVRLGWLDARFVPPPSAVVLRFFDLAGSGVLWTDVSITLFRIACGFTLGVIPGVAVGLLMAMFKPLRYVLDPLVAAIYPIPKIALMPLLMLAFGIGELSKIALVAIGTFFPVLISTYAGAANIEPIYLDAAKNFRAGAGMMFREVIFFGALPQIFAGLRLALGTSFLVIVAAEFVSADTGIGQLIWSSWQVLQVDRMFVGIVLIGVLGVASTAILQEIEYRLMPWRKR
jgi:ABC-type nitrate/sulfonate/bicarbonate transport system permease component